MVNHNPRKSHHPPEKAERFDLKADRREQRASGGYGGMAEAF